MSLDLMVDSTDPAGIPSTCPIPQYVLGYTDGDWPDWAQMLVRFPTATPVRLSAIPGSSGAGIAHGWDGEKGDYDPAQAAALSAAKLAAGVVPVGYCSDAAWLSYQTAHRAAGIDPAQVDWIIAAYPGIGQALYPGTVAHQYEDAGPYDLSVVQPGWVPGRSINSPHPNPSPPPIEENIMATTAPFLWNNSLNAIQASAGGLWHFWEIGSAAKTGESILAKAGNIGITVPPQTPQISVTPGALQVLIEDSNAGLWYFMQPAGTGEWNPQQVS